MRTHVATVLVVVLMAGCGGREPATPGTADERDGAAALEKDLCGRSPTVHAEEVWGRALAEARAWSTNATLISLGPQTCSARIPEFAVTTRGRFDLRSHRWSFEFVDAGRGEVAYVYASSKGAEIYSFVEDVSEKAQRPLDPAWVDSSTILATLREDPRTAPALEKDVCDGFASLGAEDGGPPIWSVRFEAADGWLAVRVSPGGRSILDVASGTETCTREATDWSPTRATNLK